MSAHFVSFIPGFFQVSFFPRYSSGANLPFIWAWFSLSTLFLPNTSRPIILVAMPGWRPQSYFTAVDPGTSILLNITAHSYGRQHARIFCCFQGKQFLKRHSLLLITHFKVSISCRSYSDSLRTTSTVFFSLYGSFPSSWCLLDKWGWKLHQKVETDTSIYTNLFTKLTLDQDYESPIYELL